MSNAIVTIVVPSSGDGPIANISSLLGDKTVELSGFYTGSYTLLASHDNSTFVPVLLFNANGLESIKETLSDSYISVRIRCNANTTQSTPVTASIAGVSNPGANRFATLVTLPPGFVGTTLPFDTYALFPTTGLESDINLICKGQIDGTIVVEGSQDGVGFNPIGTFQGGPQQRPLIGLPPILEFTPLSTPSKVRYLRFAVSGQIAGSVVLTIGGSILASSGSGGSTFLEFNEDEGRSANAPTSEGPPPEVILYEWTANLSDIPVGQNIAVQLNATIKSIDPAHVPLPVATFNVYVGSTTPGDTSGGTLQVTTNTSSGTEVLVSVTSALFPNPGGTCQIQVTGQSTSPIGLGEINQAIIRAISVIVG